MIPITSQPTTLSFEKSALLLQNLINLKNEKNIKLPKSIQEEIDEQIEAQNKFITCIDKYMQYHIDEKYLYQGFSYDDEDDDDFDDGSYDDYEDLLYHHRLETVTTIVETCSEFLATKDGFGQIPCHHAAKYINHSDGYRILLLYANMGIKYGVGGEESRGGLLVPDERGKIALYSLNDAKSFRNLSRNDPPLLQAEDVQKYHLLHRAVKNQPYSMEDLQFLYDLDPSCIYQLDARELLPIDYAIGGSIAIFGYLIRKSVLHSISDDRIGGLFTERKNHETRLLLDELVEIYGKDCAWNCIEKSVSVLEGIPILHQTIKHSPKNCDEVLKRFPDSIHVRDQNNRLPIHVALETGMKFSIELSYLINASQPYLKDVDPVTKWPPFTLAAMGRSCDLRTIYTLLHKNPEHVEMTKDGRYKYIPVENCKSRKVR